MSATMELTTLARLRRVCASGEARDIRLRSRVSLAEMGREVGCGPTTILKWEKGQRRPRGDLALRYAAVLDQLTATEVAPAGG